MRLLLTILLISATYSCNTSKETQKASNAPTTSEQGNPNGSRSQTASKQQQLSKPKQ